MHVVHAMVHVVAPHAYHYILRTGMNHVTTAAGGPLAVWELHINSRESAECVGQEGGSEGCE